MQRLEHVRTTNEAGAGREKKRFVPPKLVCYGELGRITMQSYGGEGATVTFTGSSYGTSLTMGNSDPP